MKTLWLILGIAAFAILMGFRQSAETMWGKVLISAAAGAILAVAIGTFKKKPS